MRTTAHEKKRNTEKTRLISKQDKSDHLRGTAIAVPLFSEHLFFQKTTDKIRFFY